MKIAGAQLELASSHVSIQESSVEEKLRMWIGPRRPNFEGENPGRGGPPALPPSAQADISEAGRSAQANGLEEQIDEAMDDDAGLRLIRAMLEYLLGRKINVYKPEAQGEQKPSAAQERGNAPERAGFGIEYDYRSVYAESESTTFSASGKVLTADGQQIEFSLDLSMERSFYREESFGLRAGDAVLKDPLVLNFAGTAAQLGNTHFKFDLDADGTAEDMPFVSGGSGFLVFDRNGDGKVNNGLELFGPRTGNGFAELAELDSDENGWIDESDEAWGDLRLWTKDADGGDQLRTLLDANVGALALAHVATPFALKDAENSTLGQIRSSGVFLQEDGGAGTMQQIDIAV